MIIGKRNHPTVCVVTVTYGKRLCFLSEVMQALEKQSYQIEKVIVIDNGSHSSLKSSLPSYNLPVSIVKMTRNLGSAEGFSTGLQHALNCGTDLIWLLDDDNKPSPSALEIVVKAFVELSNNNTNRIVLSSKRLLPGERRRETKTTRKNRFLNFHFRDSGNIFDRVLWFLCDKKPTVRCSAPASIDKLKPIRIAPYGGLLIPSSFVSQIGLPRTDFVTYGDDVEWTLRFHNAGGQLYSCLDSIVYDIDSSWWIRKDKLNPIVSPSTNEAIIYYGIRNQIYTELRDSNIIFSFLINGFIRLISLLINLLIYSQDKYISLKRYLLLLRAIFDGIRGKLGRRNKFDKMFD